MTAPRAIVRAGALAVACYVVAGLLETLAIEVLRPSELELGWVSDVVLSAVLGLAVYLWINLRATREALTERERADVALQVQLSLAEDMQRRLLPDVPSPAYGLEWAAALRPAGQIGGDFYDLVALGPGHWMVLVSDVSGKGIPAAMALSTVRATFRSLTKHERRPGTVLAEQSTELYEQWGGDAYLTAIVLEIDRMAGALTYANAAHPSGLVVRQQGVEPLASGGPPVALLPTASYEQAAVAITAGDLCVLVSDGVTEALGDDGLSIVARVAQAVTARSPQADAVCDAVLGLAMDGHGPPGVADWQDDRTVVVIAFTGDDHTLPSIATKAGKLE